MFIKKIIIFANKCTKNFYKMVDIVLKYNKYLDELSNIIKNSYYKAEYFIQNLGISEGTYYRKLREKSFTTEEVKTLTELLYPDELILKALEESENDIKNGKTYTHKEAMNYLRTKHFS